MLKIGKAQMSALSQAAVKDFEDRMIAHLRSEFSTECDRIQEQALRDFIQYGIQRAATHALRYEYHVCLYLHLMMLLGRDFDQAPEHEWAQRLLARLDSAPRERLERLHELAHELHASAQGGLP